MSVGLPMVVFVRMVVAVGMRMSVALHIVMVVRMFMNARVPAVFVPLFMTLPMGMVFMLGELLCAHKALTTLAAAQAAP